MTRDVTVIKQVAVTMNDAGVLDLMEFSVQAPHVLSEVYQDAIVDQVERTCCEDLIDLVKGLRRWASSVPEGDRAAAAKLSCAKAKAKPGLSPKGELREHKGEECPDRYKSDRVSRETVDHRARERSGHRARERSDRRAREKSDRKRRGSLLRDSDRRDRERNRSESPLDRLESSVRKLRSDFKRGKDGDLADDDDDLVHELDKNQSMSRTVNKLLTDKGLDCIDSDFLPDPKTIVDLHNVFCKHKCPYISSKPLDDMVPVHVVQGLPSQEKKDVLKTRANETMTMARLLELVMAFWLSHHIAGIVSLGAIVQHLLILTKMAQKKNVLTAVWYARYLPAHVGSVVNKGKMTVDECLTSVLDAVEKKVTDQLDPKDKKPGLFQRKNGKDRGGKGGRRKDLSKSPKPRRGRDRSVSKEKEVPKPPVPQKEQICLAHDPANGQKCTRDNCPRKHLDTKVPKNAKLFLETKNLVRKLRKWPR